MLHFRAGCWALGLLLMLIAVAGAQPAADAAPGPLELLTQEIKIGLAHRQQTEAFARYLNYTAGRLDASAGDKTWRDKTGNCRLTWVDALLRDQVWAIGEAERFTQAAYTSAVDPTGIAPFLNLAAQKLDAPLPAAVASVTPASAPLTLLQNALQEADGWLTKAFAPLDAGQRATLREHFYAVSTGLDSRGHRFAGSPLSRTVCDLMAQADHRALHAAGRALAPLTTPAFAVALAQQLTAEAQTNSQRRLKLPMGELVLGTAGDDVYQLDEMPGVIGVIDPAGNDTYVEGTLSETRQLLVVIDLAGHDNYRGVQPGIQGSAILGASLLVDAAGDDTYAAEDVAQGTCLLGVGVLVDHAGNDRYTGRRRVQGVAIGGVALLLDRLGDDRYRAALLSQGIGGPLGLGALVDAAGADEYYAGGLYANSYGDSPGYDGFSQGVGIGPRGVANGGIGLLLDGGGDDLYECDYFSHGGGYWFAAGFARDFGGNDQRVGATRTAWDGGPREEKRFLRWGLGFQAHYGVGVVIDDQGNDTYQGNTAGIAFSWDIGLALLADLAGDDYYENPRIQGEQAALGVLFDAGGDDRYEKGSQGVARPTLEYHPLPQSGGNFSFLVDYGGENSFAQAQNHTYNQCGSPTGFLISRPTTPTLDLIRQPPPTPTEP